MRPGDKLCVLSSLEAKSLCLCVSAFNKNNINYGKRKQQHLGQDPENNHYVADRLGYCLRHTGVCIKRKRMRLEAHPLRLVISLQAYH